MKEWEKRKQRRIEYIIRRAQIVTKSPSGFVVATPRCHYTVYRSDGKLLAYSHNRFSYVEYWVAEALALAIYPEVVP